MFIFQMFPHFFSYEYSVYLISCLKEKKKVRSVFEILSDTKPVERDHRGYWCLLMCPSHKSLGTTYTVYYL